MFRQYVRAKSHYSFTCSGFTWIYQYMFTYIFDSEFHHNFTFSPWLTSVDIPAIFISSHMLT